MLILHKNNLLRGVGIISVFSQSLASPSVVFKRGKSWETIRP